MHNSAPAEARAEFFGGRAIDDETWAWQRLEHHIERRMAHLVVRPGRPRPQHQRHVIEDRQIVEPRTEFAPRVRCRLGVIGQRKRAASEIGLGVTWHVEALHLQRRVRSHPDRSYAVAITRFDPPAVALRIEFCGNLIAQHETVGRHPMIGESEGGGDIGWP